MPCMGLPLCIWMGGIRRAEKKMPQCGIFPPWGARARASASAERKQAAARAENPFLCAASEQALYRLLRLFHCMIKAGARSRRCSSFPQKVPLGSPARLQARSQRLAIAANLLREQSGRPMHRMGLPLYIYQRDSPGGEGQGSSGASPAGKCSSTIAFSCAAISENSRFKSSVRTLILLPLIR